MIALLVTVSHAFACDDVFYSVGLDPYRDELHRALDQDDLLPFYDVLSEIKEKVQCLDQPIGTDIWADVLVSIAMVQYAKRSSFEGVLSAALEANEDWTRQMLSQHPLHDWSEPYTPQEGLAAPKRVTVWVDGVQSDVIPLQGVHLIQVQMEDEWRTVFLTEGEPLPASMYPSELLPNWSFDADVGVGIMSRMELWTPSVDGDWLSAGSGIRPLWVLLVEGETRSPWGPGLWWDLTAAPKERSLPSAYAGGMRYIGDLGLGIGGGFFQARAETMAGPSDLAVAQLRVLARVQRERSHVVGALGGGPSGVHGGLHLRRVRPMGPIHQDFGLRLNAEGAVLEQQETSRDVRTWMVGATLWFGLGG